MVCNPILAGLHHLNWRSVASIIAALTQTLSVNGPLRVHLYLSENERESDIACNEYIDI